MLSKDMFVETTWAIRSSSRRLKYWSLLSSLVSTLQLRLLLNGLWNGSVMKPKVKRSVKSKALCFCWHFGTLQSQFFWSTLILGIQINLKQKDFSLFCSMANSRIFQMNGLKKSVSSSFHQCFYKLSILSFKFCLSSYFEN